MPLIESLTGLVSHLSTNPYFSAGFGLIGVGTGMAALRVFGKSASFYFKKKYMLTMEIPNRDRSYPWMLNWLSRHGPKNTQHLSVETNFVQQDNGEVVAKTDFVPNVGDHYFTHKGHLIKVERQREKNAFDITSGNVWESITLSTVGTNRALFMEIIDEAKTQALAKEENKTVIYTCAGTEWRRFGFPRRRRPLPSVILHEGVSESLLTDVRDFLGSAAWYVDRGIPYRRGYLLHGPPGCGKSSFIYALAGELGLNICVLNLHMKGINDDVLIQLLVNAPQRSVILLEDIDAALVDPTEAVPLPAGSGEQQQQQARMAWANSGRVTFTGLLNALDGVVASEGRVMFMTTNHIDRLDPALIRPGRVDVIQGLYYASRHQMNRIWEKFFPDHSELASKFSDRVLPNTVSMAYLQNYLMAYRGDPEAAIKNTTRIFNKETASAPAPNTNPNVNHPNQKQAEK